MKNEYDLEESFKKRGTGCCSSNCRVPAVARFEQNRPFHCAKGPWMLTTLFSLMNWRLQEEEIQMTCEPRTDQGHSVTEVRVNNNTLSKESRPKATPVCPYLKYEGTYVKNSNHGAYL